MQRPGGRDGWVHVGGLGHLSAFGLCSWGFLGELEAGMYLDPEKAFQVWASEWALLFTKSLQTQGRA